jgi:hypothetical protein
MPERIRISELWIRSPTLYPPGHMGKIRFPGGNTVFSSTRLQSELDGLTKPVSKSSRREDLGNAAWVSTIY